MTAQDRARHARNQERSNPTLPSQGRVAAPAQPDMWLAKRVPSKQPGIIWLKRPMPDGQWPPDQSLPRDDSFSWWVRSHCGHQGGARQWAFYTEADADVYEQIFREDPCRWTRCPERIMIENEGRSRG